MENNRTFNPAPQDIPDSLLILILGILSIIVNGFFPGIGLIPSIIALVKHKKAKKLYLENPGDYTRQSSDYLKGGQITSIIGLVISGFIILTILIALVVFFYVLLIEQSL